MSMSTRERPASAAPRHTRTGGRRRVRGRLSWISAAAGISIGLLWLGLRIQPAPLQRFSHDLSGDDLLVPLPPGLPEPVERFYRTLYGAQVPAVDSAVITGRGTMRIKGVTLPARFRFSHVTGQSYRHYIENTFLGLPVLKINEWFTGGAGVMDLPFGRFEGEKIDQGGNLALWAEGVFMPSIWITDTRVHWEPVDSTSARLVAPFGDDSETFTVIFDAASGLLQRMESMRFKSEDSEAKTLWINEVVEWGRVDGHPVPVATTLTWQDEGSPWARLCTEEVVYNADLSEYVHESGLGSGRPTMSGTQQVTVRLPFRGTWLARNSPARRVPSHGTDLFATTYAIDFVAVEARVPHVCWCFSVPTLRWFGWCRGRVR
jgi:hypothetical protein